MMPLSFGPMPAIPDAAPAPGPDAEDTTDGVGFADVTDGDGLDRTDPGLTSPPIRAGAGGGTSFPAAA